jgi:hypothetical protein
MSYSQQRFSPLNQINRQTVKRLVPAWSYSMTSNHGEESQALIKDGVMYVTSHDKCLYRKSNSAIMVMKSSEDRRRYDAAHVLDGAMDRSVLVERAMRPQLVIVGGILR